MTPRMALGIPVAMALLSSSGLVLATAAGPSYTTDCHKSQSTGTWGPSDGPAMLPDAVPGARLWLETGGIGDAGVKVRGPSFSSPSTLVGLTTPSPTEPVRLIRLASALGVPSSSAACN